MLRFPSFLSVLFLAAPMCPQPAPKYVVVCNTSVEAYREALLGVRDVLGDGIRLESPATLAGAAFRSAAEADITYIAIGRDAMKAAEGLRGRVVAGMILRQDGEPAEVAYESRLDVPPHKLLPEVRRLFPKVTRLGVLTGRFTDAAELRESAKECGFSVETAVVASSSRLLAAFLSLKGKCEIVIALPNAEVYNSVTFPPLILASIENRLPVVGFTAAFVRAGAAAGVFADFRDSGRQAAEAALRGKDGTAEHPRKLVIAVNERVLRLIGVPHSRFPDLVEYR